MQLLTKGNRQRTQEPTAANTTSSRSHAVLQVTVRQHRRGTDMPEEVRVGRLFLVDLAGSERASQVPALPVWGRHTGALRPLLRDSGSPEKGVDPCWVSSHTLEVWRYQKSL